MNIGRLRHRIKIEQLQDGIQDPETGDIINGWQTIKECYASIEPLSGREYIAASATQSSVTTRITIRYTDITTKDRIIHKDTYYNIEAVLPDNQTGLGYITLMCHSGVNKG